MTAKTKVKDSCIPWVGKIPAHWNEVPLCGLFYDKQIKNFEGRENNVLSLSYGNIIRRNVEDNYGLLPESFNTYQIVNPGDIILRLTDLQNDKRSLRVGLVKEKGIITSAYLCLSPLFSNTQNNPEYFYYLIHSYDIYKIFYNLGGGVRQSTGFKDFKRMLLLVPPKTEQDEIVRYIKTQSDNIAQFIRNKVKFIELLKEQRQCIINDAVMINHNNWQSIRLKYISELIFSNVDKHSHDDEIPIRLCNYVDVYKNDFINNEMNFMFATATEGEIDRFKILKGDIIITKDSETANDIAVPALVKNDLENVVCGYHLALIRPYTTQIMSEFLFRSLQSKKMNSYFREKATGVTRVGLSLDDIKSAIIFYPKSLKRQQEIVSKIEIETQHIDAGIIKAQKEIELMKEYKEAMIAEAVMGKLKLAK